MRAPFRFLLMLATSASESLVPGPYEVRVEAGGVAGITRFGVTVGNRIR